MQCARRFPNFFRLRCSSLCRRPRLVRRKSPSAPPPPAAPLITLGDSAVPSPARGNSLPATRPCGRRLRPARLGATSISTTQAGHQWTSHLTDPEVNRKIAPAGIAGYSYPAGPRAAFRTSPATPGIASAFASPTDANPSLWLKMPSNFDDAYQVYANGQNRGRIWSVHSTPPTRLLVPARYVLLPSASPNGDIELRNALLHVSVDPDKRLQRRRHASSATCSACPSQWASLCLRRDTQLALQPLWAISRCHFLPRPGTASLWLWIQNRREMAFLWLFISLVAPSFTTVSGLVRPRHHSISGTPRCSGYSPSWAHRGYPVWIMLWWHWFGLTKKRWIPLAAWLMAAANLIVSPAHPFSAGDRAVRAASRSMVYRSPFSLAVCMFLLVVLV